MSATDPPRRRVFLALEGGGAKGLVHLGALHAIEGSGRLEVVGHAGTSAGAMVAALAAAGYDAETIFRLTPEAGAGESILGRLGIPNAPALFGRGGWASIAAFRALYGGAGRIDLSWGSNLLILLAWLLATGRFAAAAGLLLAAIALAAGLAARLLCFGVSLAPVRAAFDRALREAPALAPRRATGPVTFAELPGLKLCAANISRRRLELFSAQTTPEVAVADAVCASICFPFAFRPWAIERGGCTERFLDGGLLSNLPAWPFDEERRLDPHALTLAVSTGEETAPPRDGFWLGGMLRTALFGAQVLSTRGAGAIEVLPLDSDVDVFDFDVTRRRAVATVAQARLAFAALLRYRVLDGPDRLRELSRLLAERSQAWLAARPWAFAPDEMVLPLRAAFAVPENHVEGGFLRASAVDRMGRGRVRSLTLRYGAGFEDSADESLVIPVENTAVGHAWLTGQDTFRALGPLDPPFLGDANRHRRRLLPPDLAWVLAVPVTLPPLEPRDAVDPVRAVFVLDGRTPLSATPGIEGRFTMELDDLIAEEIRPRFRW